jgi:uncharacterized damage-inducible protein DinB
MLEFMRYNTWATQKLLTACTALNEAQLATDAPGAYGTLRALFEHIVRADSFYLRLLTGETPTAPFDWKAQPSLAVLQSYAALVDAKLEAAALTVPLDATIDRRRDGESESFHALAIFVQIVNHGIEHRTNITTILNQNGLNPPDLDGWGYMFANAAHFEYKN